LKVLDVGCGNAPKGDVNLDLIFNGKWKNFINKHLPKWQIETKFIAKIE